MHGYIYMVTYILSHTYKDDAKLTNNGQTVCRHRQQMASQINNLGSWLTCFTFLSRILHSPIYTVHSAVKSAMVLCSRLHMPHNEAFCLVIIVLVGAQYPHNEAFCLVIIVLVGAQYSYSFTHLFIFFGVFSYLFIYLACIIHDSFIPCVIFI